MSARVAISFFLRLALFFFFTQLDDAMTFITPRFDCSILPRQLRAQFDDAFDAGDY